MIGIKRSLVALSLTLVAINTADAEVVPYGCYVTDSERLYFSVTYGEDVSCYATSDGYYSWTTHATASGGQLIDAYGSFAEALIFSDYKNYNNSLTQATSLAKQLALVKKLRRACGSKCKRIK
jgi:hypothetical protein